MRAGRGYLSNGIHELDTFTCCVCRTWKADAAEKRVALQYATSAGTTRYMHWAAFPEAKYATIQMLSEARSQLLESPPQRTSGKSGVEGSISPYPNQHERTHGAHLTSMGV